MLNRPALPCSLEAEVICLTGIAFITQSYWLEITSQLPLKSTVF